MTTASVLKERMVVAGDWVAGHGDETLNVVNPATEALVATVPKGTREDARAALDSAEEAQKEWAELPPLKRASLMMGVARLIRENRERLANVLTMEQGKPLIASRLEIDSSAAHFE